MVASLTTKTVASIDPAIIKEYQIRLFYIAYYINTLMFLRGILIEVRWSSHQSNANIATIVCQYNEAICKQHFPCVFIRKLRMTVGESLRQSDTRLRYEMIASALWGSSFLLWLQTLALTLDRIEWLTWACRRVSGWPSKSLTVKDIIALHTPY